jgi:redox-sensitive bicupin YhaK (pirin superfamily)
MIQQSKAKIFLSDERGHNENEWYRSLNTFNFGNYKNEHKHAFGSLYVLNDDTLAAGKKLSLTVQENSLVVLIPVVGAVDYKDSNGNTALLQAGEALRCNVQQNTGITIDNPYENETINFLQLWIKHEATTANTAQLVSFDINSNNKLHTLFAAQENKLPAVSIGKYDGRAEDTYKLKNKQHGVFAFVIEGAFEVQNRLLHARDGLALCYIEEIEFEALSNEAIILLVECEI